MVANEKWFGAVTGFYNDQVTRSLRFEQSDSPDLSLSSLSGGSTTKATIAFWCKRGDLSDDMRMWSCYDGSGTNRNQIGFLSGNTLNVQIGDTAMRTTNRVFKDTAAWYHIVVAFDSSQSTANDRIKIYVNGVQETSFSTTNNPSQDADIKANNGKIYWGRRETSSLYFDGYLAECVQIDGAQLAGTSFGEFKEGVFIPIDISGLTYGTNGHRLQYLQTGTSQNSSGIGADTSGNNKHFAVTNLAASDVVKDTPENNFCTINFQAQSLTSTVAASQGNLFFDGSTLSPSNYDAGVVCNFGMKGGKWYWETRLSGGGTPADARDWNVGFAPYSTISKSVDDGTYGQSLGNGSSATLSGYGYTQVNSGGTHGIRHNNSTSAFGSAHTSGDILGHALDLENGTWIIYKNGSSLGTAVTGIDTSFTYFAAGGANGGTISSFDVTFNFGQDSTFNGAVSAGGNADGKNVGDFKYAVPSGYLALCSSNLSESTLGPNSDEQANDHFEAFLYTGNSDSTRTISGFNFQADLMWNKARNQAFSHRLYDSSRGNDKGIFSNNTSVESTHDVFNGFTSDGFNTTTDGSAGDLLNYNGGTYVAWNWKANGGTTTTNDASYTSVGSEDSTYQANTTAGFSIITYSGTGGTDTIAHGLSQSPDWIIATPRDSSGSNRVVWHKGISLGTFLKLNLTDAVATSDQITSVSSTTIGVAGNANLSGKSQVIWCWHEVEGYSKFGTYSGNSSGTDGAFVYTGFAPTFLLGKVTSQTGRWWIYDSARSPRMNYSIGTGAYLTANSGVVEVADSGVNAVQLLSNGFKLNTTNAEWNGSGHTYVYMAFAEMPFKYSLAR